MKLKIIPLLLFFAVSAKLSAQQDAMYSQYMFNMLAVNPAYAGSRDVVSMTALQRWQWTKIDGAPRSTTFSADMPMAKERVGVGVQFFRDKVGVTGTTGMTGSYAFRIRFKNSGTLALGLQAGLVQYSANLAEILPTTTTGSDVAFSQNINKIMPNFGAGIYYTTDKFYLGLSAPHLLNNSLSKSASAQAIQRKHYFAMAGMVFPISYRFKLKPSMLMKYVNGSPLELDVNANLWFKDVLSLGLSYRTGDAVIGLLEIQATERIKFGYAYDHTLTRLGKYNSGSHEIMLRYEFGSDKSMILSPRYF
jgi:type IX secretion system PorP/SprF family membrane protein